jgi:hypothetical protein
VHSGDRDTARELARRNIEAFEKLGLDAVIINAAGCGSTLKEYGHLLARDPEWAERAERFAHGVKDVNEFLAGIELNRQMGPVRKRVTYQDPCHLVHGQGIRTQPRELLKAIPELELVELQDSDVCCGSAGIYNVTHYDLSMHSSRNWTTSTPRRPRWSWRPTPAAPCRSPPGCAAASGTWRWSTSSTCWTRPTGPRAGRGSRRREEPLPDAPAPSFLPDCSDLRSASSSDFSSFRSDFSSGRGPGPLELPPGP